MIAFPSRVQLVTETNKDSGRDIIGRNNGRNGFHFDRLFLHTEIRKGYIEKYEGKRIGKLMDSQINSIIWVWIYPISWRMTQARKRGVFYRNKICLHL